MFNSPQLGSTTDAALPVIDMQESAETLAHLVTVIYPTIFFPPTTVDSLMALLAALQKYGMGLEVDGTLAKYRAQFRLSYLPRFLVEQACRAYMLAVHYRLKEEAQLAARALLASPVTFESCGDDMRLLPTGAALHDLVQYRVGCRDAAKAALLDGLASHDDSAWFRSPERRIPIQEPSPFGGGSMSRTVMAQECTTQRRPVRGCAQSPALPGWLATHLEYIHTKLGVAGGLALSADVEAAVFESCSSALQAHLDGGGAEYCVSCAAAHAEDRDVLWTTLAKTIGKAIAEVAFECFW
ncbi:hypothetical protein FA95DRAFT_1562820 [Auriscalpium vulgare]|uniref:Uncharacterized protein n=1 Tax=Auriscalpium vulgare TaxID=40419 RepID=A0ACB8RIW3_9AGAM|nr:hypothetical protein FA95DRAFT_1562820 [Auriscalpium vulgare]